MFLSPKTLFPLVALLLSALMQSSPAEGRRLNVLLLGHKPGMHAGHQTQARYQQLFQALGPKGINLDFTDDPDHALNARTLANYDALALYANWEKITPDQEKALFDYVESGHGFVPIHCASACFLNSMRCTALIGGRFQRHQTGEFETRIVKPDHPVMRGFRGFKTWDETYVHDMHNPDKIVLQRRVDARAGDDEPWTWVRAQGRGRVFYTAYGHDERTWSQPGFHDLIFRGILWAVGEQAAAEFKKLKLAPLEHVAGALVPNYEQRTPPPLLQKPLSPADAQAHIYTPAGIDLTLVASETDGLWNVIEFKFDETGRLWTCESLDYPNEIKPQGRGRDRIRILEDTNGDGKIDRATVFADGLSIPTSLVFHDGGIIVLNLPDTTFLKDTDGDGRADERKVLFTGWGTGDTHACPSNLAWGFDGWVYGCVGYSGFSGSVGGERLRFGSGIYRFKPDGTRLEFLGATSNNTWGFAFTENGDLFGSTANNQSSFYCAIPQRYYDTVPGLELGVLPGVDANKKCAIMREYIRQVDVFGGFTSAACHNFYTARVFPREYWNAIAFVAEPTCHLLYRGIAVPEGASFSVENGFNLMASDDEWFAPVYADVGPDGGIYVSDFYSFLIQHNPTPNLERGGFNAQTGKGNAFISDLRDTEHARLWKLFPKGASPSKQWKLSKDKPQELLEALQSDNLFWRGHAQRLLVERKNTDVTERLRALVANEKTDAVGVNGGAFGALWTLQGLGAADLPTVARALKHPAQGVRRTAAQLLPRSEQGLQALLAAGLLADKEPLVKLAALLALSEMPASAAVGAQLGRLAQSDAALSKDRWLRDGLVIAASRHAAGFLSTALASAKGGPESAPKAAPVNLLTNPGFEESQGAGPRAWNVRTYSGSADHALDTAVARTGKNSLRISSKTGADSSWHFDLPVEPHSDYLLTGWVKTDKLATLRGGKGAMLELHHLNGAQPATAPLKGTQNWTQLTLPFSTGPQKEISINLLYGGWGHATGTAWWDDLSLTKSTSHSQADALTLQVAGALAKSGRPEARAEIARAVAENKSPLADAIGQILNSGGMAAKKETLADLKATHQILQLGVLVGQMKFDKAELTAKSDRPIVIEFSNPDQLQHNVVAGKPGSLEKIGAAANAMMAQADGLAKSYIPEMPEVLGGTKLANPGEKLLFKLPALAPGDYPLVCTFPGHWAIMRATLKVTK
ncbi:MAG: ThuA domain-containing protein [Verrucomicrobiales bacterium]|nr:ThuA domain-containing protein [Verrucomicrobiales bacterium]